MRHLLCLLTVFCVGYSPLIHAEDPAQGSCPQGGCAQGSCTQGTCAQGSCAQGGCAANTTGQCPAKIQICELLYMDDDRAPIMIIKLNNGLKLLSRENIGALYEGQVVEIKPNGCNHIVLIAHDCSGKVIAEINFTKNPHSQVYMAL